MCPSSDVCPRWWPGRILWIDGLAALTAGVAILAGRHLLSALYALPVGLIAAGGIVNLAYASYGLTLAIWTTRRVGFVAALAVANASWAVVCVSLAIWLADDATALGLLSLLLEGAFVATLGLIEWRHRHALARR